MMIKNGSGVHQGKSGSSGLAPCLSITKLGIVSRDYQHKFANGYRDFSHALPDVLKLLDNKGCDAVLFSLFSIVPRQSYDPRTCFTGLKNIKGVFIEEFEDGKERIVKRYVVHHRTGNVWEEYDFNQRFATITGMKEKEINSFVINEMPKRILGNCCVLLCGETNGVKYSPKDNNVHDVFGLRQSVSKNTNIILNPIHDRMTRFEMKLKRQFLSQNNKWVISVWNKGKEDKNGNVRDGNEPAWTIFSNGKEVVINPIKNVFGIEVGILDLGRVI